MTARIWTAAMLVAASVSAPAMAQTRSISQSDRAQGAQANPQLIAQYGGAYGGPQSAYVERIGKRVALQSGLSNASGDFTVTLLNSPVENAFAIPGGYVYVTRQLLALMNSEAELAAVLGHEVGHVAARHSNSRSTRSTIGNLFAAGLGAVTGSDILGRVAGIGSQLYTLSYSRNQEYQADQFGVRYATAAGYAPIGMAEALSQLNEAQALGQQTSGRDATAVPTWMSTHPNGAERVRRAEALATQAGGTTAQPAQDVTYLRMLDGLRYDDDPAQGVIDGSIFRHPALRIRFTAPSGYTIANGTDAVTIAGQGGQAEFRMAAAGDPASVARQRLTALGAQNVSEPRVTRINGTEVAIASARATASNRQVDVTVAAYRYPSATYLFQIVTPAGQGIGPFESLLQSLAPLTQAEASAITGKRIRIATVRANDTIDSLARQMAYGDYQRERFLTLNGLGDDARLVPGQLVKLVVKG
ncbi:peptidase M48 Ste24p [Sphingomonas sp. Leaf407]|uniref:M48 family metalloprotease n=1 Tax=unclassified Sphingomonas TaxID=196159 RepID=UPI0006F25D93|nr:MULTISPECIES: M48 family metalloprotease [unclassified Sphingomonas]KQN40702.1 peptidase M48 Ste24p [Sphingomonas sp. Leaf42]KQT30058.1 peptidase M48 Ste24p [Sphingomonas sp. Leaf407]